MKTRLCVCVCAFPHYTEVSNEIAICQDSFLCRFEDMRRFREGQESHCAGVLLTAATKHCASSAGEINFIFLALVCVTGINITVRPSVVKTVSADK